MKSADSYLHTYISRIVPKLREIDLYVKESSGVMSYESVARVLDISAEEVRRIAGENNISRITRGNFFRVMAGGSSFICGLYHREVECGSPYVYTRSDVSYIYQIDPETVNRICDELDICEVTAYSLPDLLAKIAV